MFECVDLLCLVSAQPLCYYNVVASLCCNVVPWLPLLLSHHCPVVVPFLYCNVAASLWHYASICCSIGAPWATNSVRLGFVLWLLVVVFANGLVQL